MYKIGFTDKFNVLIVYFGGWLFIVNDNEFDCSNMLYQLGDFFSMAYVYWESSSDYIQEDVQRANKFCERYFENYTCDFDNGEKVKGLPF